MDRKIVYPAQIPMVEDQLLASRFTQIGIGRLAGALFGEGGLGASGLTCAPASGMAVSIAPGQIIQSAPVDATSYGVLAADSDVILTQYLLNEAVSVAVPGVGATYTVYGTLSVTDIDNAVLPFYNSANPSQVYAGPDNNGASTATTRASIITLGIATSVPSGAVPLWQIVVPSTATAITDDMISVASGSPFYPSIPQMTPRTTLPFNAALAAAYGGYPFNALLADPSTEGLFWASTAANNLTPPGASGANWIRSDFYKATPSTLTQTSSAGNFTVPAGVYRIRFRLRAGGGGGGAGGGNSTTAVSAGGGGGGGGWIEVIIAVVPGNNVSWVVGAGGSAGVNNGTSGTSGGDTILYVSGVEVARVTGGGGGINATEGGVGQGGAGGSYAVTSAVGYEHQDGAGGGYGIYAGISQGWGGTGGPSYGHSSVLVTGQSTAGITGQTGGGGSGGTGTSNGGAGTAGEVIYDY